MWAYLNWALGLREAGCEVIWLEWIRRELSDVERERRLALLKQRLAPYGLSEAISLWYGGDDAGALELPGCLPLEDAWDADLLLNLNYWTRADVVNGFRRSVSIDIDPGLTQAWIAERILELPRHDRYFSIGERLADVDGISWEYTPPCVSTKQWKPSTSVPDAAFTTVAHWSGGWMGSAEGGYDNDKRSAFLPYLDLPTHVRVPLELMLYLAPEEQEERALLERKGWRVRNAEEVAAPWDYQRYVAGSLGEFSCAKPSYVLGQTGWISDRTLCYLASGKPVIVQHTGPSRLLPAADGAWRFRTPAEAIQALDEVAADYVQQSRLARELALEHFDARKVVSSVLERVLT